MSEKLLEIKDERLSFFTPAGLEGGGDDKGADAVGEKVLRDDPPAAGPQGPGGGDVLGFLQQ